MNNDQDTTASVRGSELSAELGQEWRTDVARIWRKVYGGAQCDASAFEFAAEIEAAARAAERERWQARIEEAFKDGFYAPRTYNDTVLNTAGDAWEEAKAGLLRA